MHNVLKTIFLTYVQACYLALSDFAAKHDGRKPRPWNEADREEFVEMAAVAAAREKIDVELDRKLCGIFASICAGIVNPVCAAVGEEKSFFPYIFD